MSNHVAYSWPYGDSENETRAFYQRLKGGREAGHAFPFSQYQIALVRGSYTWFVAVLVLTDSSGDDSVYIHNQCEEWFKKCGDGNYQDYESIPLRGSSIESSIGTDYDILESFGTQRGEASRRPAPSATKAAFTPTVSSFSTSSSSTSPAEESKKSVFCPRCGAPNFNLECDACGYVEWGVVAVITALAIVFIGVAIFWFTGFYWRWGFGLFGGLLFLVPMIIGIKFLMRRFGYLAAKKVSDDGDDDDDDDDVDDDDDSVASSGGGASSLAVLFNNMSEQGAAGFAKMLNSASSQDVENLARQLNSASGDDVQALAEGFNRTGRESDAEFKQPSNPAPSAIKVHSTRTLEGHKNLVPFLRFTADSQFLISVERSWGGKLMLWNVAEGRAIATREVGDFAEGLWISDDGRTLAVFGQSNRVYVFQMPGAEPVLTIDAHEDSIKAAAISADGRSLATGVSYRDTPPKIWKLPEGKLLHTLPISIQIGALQFSPDGAALICGGEDKLVTIWNTTTGQQIKTLPKEVASHYTNDIEFDASRQIMVTGEGNNAIRFIHFAGGRLLSESKAFTFHHELTFSADKQLVAGSGDNGTAIVWRMADGKKMCELRGHKEIGLHLSLSDQPRILISSGTSMGSKTDHSVRIWSIPDGAPIQVIDGLAEPPNAVAISPNGRYAVFSVENEPLRLLELGDPSREPGTLSAPSTPQTSPAPQPVSVAAADPPPVVEPATSAAVTTSSPQTLAANPAPVQPPAQPAAGELIRFSCPQCGKRIQAKPHLAGKQLRCPNKECGEKLTVPTAVPAPSAAVATTEPDPFAILEQAYLVRHDAGLAARVDASLDAVANKGEAGIQSLVRRLFRDLRIEAGCLIVPQWGDMAWNRWLQLAAVVGALGRAGNPAAIAKLVPLFVAVKDAESQFFEILQPAVISAIAQIGGGEAAAALRGLKKQQLPAGSAIAWQVALQKLQTPQGDVDRRDEDGATELYWAARKGDVAVVKSLLARGADPCAPRLQRESQGETPLHVAAAENRLEVVQLFMQHGADADVQDAIGNSPIQRAAVFGHTAIIQCLIEHGANVNIRTNAGRTPLDWAVNRTHKPAADLLRSHGGEKATASDFF